MTPNQHLDDANVRPDTAGALNLTKAASTICVLCGIWFFVSPWVYGAYTSPNAWNSWIVGGFMILFGIVRVARPAYSNFLSWFNMVLGIWTFFSPWIYGYVATNTGRFINSLCVGVIVFVFSIASAMASRNRNAVAVNRS